MGAAAPALPPTCPPLHTRQHAQAWHNIGMQSSSRPKNDTYGSKIQVRFTVMNIRVKDMHAIRKPTTILGSCSAMHACMDAMMAKKACHVRRESGHHAPPVTPSRTEQTPDRQAPESALMDCCYGGWVPWLRGGPAQTRVWLLQVLPSNIIMPPFHRQGVLRTSRGRPRFNHIKGGRRGAQGHANILEQCLSPQPRETMLYYMYMNRDMASSAECKACGRMKY
jgi:hypothetical protein